MGFLESANSLMGHTIYEQRELERMAEELENSDVEKEEEVEEGLDSISAIASDEEEGDIGGDEEGEEEPEMISVEDAIKAIQMVLDGSAETPEEAIELVKSESGEEGESLDTGDGDEADELGDEGEIGECKGEPEGRCKGKGIDFNKYPDGKKRLSEEDECEEGEEEEEEKEKDSYGESHSLFLKLSQRYL